MRFLRGGLWNCWYFLLTSVHPQRPPPPHQCSYHIHLYSPTTRTPTIRTYRELLPSASHLTIKLDILQKKKNGFTVGKDAPSCLPPQTRPPTGNLTEPRDIVGVLNVQQKYGGPGFTSAPQPRSFDQLQPCEQLPPLTRPGRRKPCSRLSRVTVRAPAASQIPSRCAHRRSVCACVWTLLTWDVNMDSDT